MTVVVAQGTFDLLHTGHLHYLSEAATHGDELVVIIARQDNITHKPAPILPAEQRRELVEAFEVVDRAMLGDRDDIFLPIERLNPDVIVLGHDQHHEEQAINAELRDRGISADVVRVSEREPVIPGEILSTSAMIERILVQRG